jgi:glycosyltransferase involved in cell wall biosynthesis
MVSEMFYPDETSTAYILTKIANHLTLKYDVNVICGPSVYDKDKKIVTSSVVLSNNVEVVRKKTFNNKNNLFVRFFSTFFLSLSLSFSLLRRIKKNDVIFIGTHPPTLLLFISLLKIITKNRLVILVHDVFPENTIPAKIFKSSQNIIYKISKGLFDWSYVQADLLIVLGADMKDVVSRKILKKSIKTKIEIVHNWADTYLVYPTQIDQSYNKIRILYAGNLGRLQGLKDLILIMSQVNNPLLEFIFAGTGALKNELMNLVEQLKLKNIKFQDSFLRNEQIDILNQCEICLVTLLDEMYGLGVPSKTYNILAAGKPIIFVGHKESEIAKMVIEHEIGYVFSFNEKDTFIDFFNGLSLTFDKIFNEMGFKARKIAERDFSEKVILDRFLEIV